MKRATALALTLAAVFGTAAGAFAQDTKVFRDLLVVDANGRKIGAVADGLASDQALYVLAETERRVFLIAAFKDAFIADGTVRYTGAGCTGEAFVTGVVDPALLFVEKAQIGALPGTTDLWAFLIQRSSGPVETALASYWYDGACTDEATTAVARKLVAAKDLSAFVPPFAVTVYGHDAVKSLRRP